MKQQNPHFKTTDVARELGRLWSIADETLKNHYQTQSIAEREEYHKKMSVYRQNKADEAREQQNLPLNSANNYQVQTCVNSYQPVLDPSEYNPENGVNQTSAPETTDFEQQQQHQQQVIQVHHPQQIQQIQQIQGTTGTNGTTTTTATYHILTGNQVQLMQTAQNSISFEKVSNSE